MSRSYQKVLVVVFLLVASCVFDAKEAFSLSIQGPVRTIESPSYKLRGTVYIPLIAVCDSYGLSWEWDPVGKVVVLKKNGVEARLKVESHRIFVNGNMRDLEKAPKFHENAVVVPVSFAEKTMGKIFGEWAEPVPQRPGAPVSAIRHTINTIVIDPGHGGKDPGAIGRYNLKEKEIVLDIARHLKKELESVGIKVILTRDSDTFIPLGKRADIANKAEADFFISVHANAFRSRRAKGFETYYLSEATDDGARALAAAENASLKYEEGSFYKPTECIDVWGLELDENRIESRELASSICGTVSNRLAVKNRNVKSARFYVLKHACMPAVLVEVGFISNTDDASSLKTPYYRKKLAESIGEGVLRYKREYESTNGFTE